MTMICEATMWKRTRESFTQQPYVQFGNLQARKRSFNGQLNVLLYRNC